MILEKGCKFLDCSLAETLEGGLNLEHKSELRHLDVSSYYPPKQVLEKLLIANLEKLAIRNLTISQDLMFHICNKNSSITHLNLGNCRGVNQSFYRNLDFESIQIITKELINLKEVDFSGSLGSIDSESTIRYLVNNITINLEKINLATVHNIGDDDIHILVTRFYELESINHCYHVNFLTVLSTPPHIFQYVGGYIVLPKKQYVTRIAFFGGRQY